MIKEILAAIVIDHGKWLNYLLALVFVGILSLDIDRKWKTLWLCLAGGVICICLWLQIGHCIAVYGR